MGHGFFRRTNTSEVPKTSASMAKTTEPFTRSQTANPTPVPSGQSREHSAKAPSRTGFNIAAIAGLFLVVVFGSLLVVIAALNPVIDGAESDALPTTPATTTVEKTDETVEQTDAPRRADEATNEKATPEVTPGPDTPRATRRANTSTREAPAPKPENRPITKVPLPAPVPEPTPVVEVEPDPTPAVPVSMPTTGTVTLKGDQAKVWLRNSDGNYPAGDVPPGTYQVSVVFGDDKPIKAGNITLAAGQTITLNCVAALRTCR